MLKGNGRSHQFGIVKFAITLLALAAASCTEAVAASSNSGAIQVAAISVPPANAADVLDGITLAGTHTDADVAYLRENLELLQDQLPAWYKHIEDAKPLVFAIDPAEGAHGRAAVAQCCLGGRGVITFGHHFGTLEDPDDPTSQTPEARRITFLVTLIHEVTHIRDQRAGRFLQKTDRKSCVAAESSALTTQLEFEQDLASTILSGNPALAQIYQTRLDQQIKSEAAALKTREMWDQYCGAFSQ